MHLAIINPKGGCGKTTIAFHLSQLFAKKKSDVFISDTPPGWGEEHVDLLKIATSILIPMEPSYFCLEAVQKMLQKIPENKEWFLLCNQFTNASKFALKFWSEINQLFSDNLLETKIPQSILLKRATDQMIAIHQHAPKSRIGQTFSKLADELLSKMTRKPIDLGAHKENLGSNSDIIQSEGVDLEDFGEMLGEL